MKIFRIDLTPFNTSPQPPSKWDGDIEKSYY
jgi:hypothetical protein